jgi:hypothetical protein
MTTPQAPPQAQQVPPGQQPPPPPQQEDDGLDDAALAVALSLLLLSAVSAAGVIAALKARFALSGLAWQALGGVLEDVMQDPPAVTGVIGSASSQVARMNAARRAQFVLAASRRTVGAMRDARAKGEPVMQALRDQLATERRYYQQHKQAMWDRAAAAGQIDMEAAVHGPILGWYAKRGDNRTTPECKAADRRNFYVDDPPKIGLPGVVHVGCRCTAGPPWPGGKILAGSGTRGRRAA